MVEAVSNRSRRRVSPDLSTRGIPNESRFGTAVHTIQGYSLRLALHRCANRYDAEDVLQDVFLAYRNTKIVFADDEHLKAWLIRVTINQCRRRFCSPWRTKTIESLAGVMNRSPGSLRTRLYRLRQRLKSTG